MAWSPPDPVQSSFESHADFEAALDKTFGKGKWKLTGAYRSPARENELREDGAGTVPAGATSAHSKGTPDAPGAYDIVVPGMSVAQAAEELHASGHGFAKLLPEGAHGGQGAHLHIQLGEGKGEPAWTPPDALSADKPAAPTVPAPKPTARPENFAERSARPMQLATDALVSDFKTAYAPETAEDRAGRGKTRATPRLEASDRMGRDILNVLKAPFTGAIRAFGGVDEETGESLTDFGGVVLGYLSGGEALEGGGAATRPNALKTATQRAPATEGHAGAVARLRAQGVEPAAHQAAGGVIKRVTEGAKSDIHTGMGIRAAEGHAGDSFNRALYDKALAPIGESAKGLPVGREGVKAVGDKLGTAYEEVLPHVKLSGDEELTGDLASIRSSVAKLGAPQEQQFEAILNSDVLHHFEAGGMDGKTFKSVESDLLRQSRNLKGSPDPNARGLGYALDDTLDALRSDMERSSDPKWRDRLKDINKGYAAFTRIQDAAARRVKGGGRITPGDLLASVKKGDRTVRKGAFARGDALLQDFAQDADTVLGTDLGDSGTTERYISNSMIHAGLGAMAGHATGLGDMMGAGLDLAATPVTNEIARRLLSRAPRTAPTHNYLKAIDQRMKGTYLPAAAVVGVGSQ